tara:strand:+ start:860 stop:1048 length:189 start_codon:yes stop_codon:yes gene_type:complete
MKDKIINIITDYYDDGDSERHEMVANDLLNLFDVIKREVLFDFRNNVSAEQYEWDKGKEYTD